MNNDLISRTYLLDIAEKQNNLLDGSDVRNAPSVECANVVNGRWVEDLEHHDIIFCSNCGDKRYFGGYRPNYCEECGAKMEKEADNEN